MERNVTTSCLVILTILLLTQTALAAKPENRCTFDGQTVCMSCTQVGMCKETSTGFTVIELTSITCDPSNNQFCDMTYADTNGNENCLKLAPSVTECACSDADPPCKIDPNNDLVYNDCLNGNFKTCDVAVDLSNCTCISALPTTMEATTYLTTTEKSKKESPEARCNYEGQLVCLSCEVEGICNGNQSTGFSVTPTGICDIQQNRFCDMNYPDPFGNEFCLSISPAITSCGCVSGSTDCKLDPNNDLAFIDCAEGSYQFCNDTIDLNSCSCLGDLTTTTDAISSTSIITSPVKTSITIASTEEGSTITTAAMETSARIITTTEEALNTTILFSITPLSLSNSCPACGYVVDDLNCHKYYYCGGEGGHIEMECPKGTSFNPTSCICDFQTGTTVDNLCGRCDMLPYPGDCNKYYKCIDGEVVLIEQNCPEGSCYDINQFLCIAISTLNNYTR